MQEYYETLVTLREATHGRETKNLNRLIYKSEYRNKLT
jgi:hypothetical protein